MISVLADPGGIAAGARLRLGAEESRHLGVRRARDGEPVTVLDGAGCRGLGRLAIEDGEFVVDVERVAMEPPPPPTVLAIGAGDRDRFGLLVDQAAQLGATAIVPVETERTAGVTTRLRDHQLERLRRRAREALKQCDSAWAPEVAEPVTLMAFLKATRAGERWLADAAGSPSPRLGPAEPLTVLVGPEGGFTAPERERILSGGWTPVRLGPHILRFEAAALAALSTAWQARQRGPDG